MDSNSSIKFANKECSHVATGKGCQLKLRIVSEAWVNEMTVLVKLDRKPSC